MAKKRHQTITQAVHQAGGRICLQVYMQDVTATILSLLHRVDLMPAISPFTPFALTHRQIKRTIADFVRTAQLTYEAGYDGVEVMGSEEFIPVNQFLCLRTNARQDQWGGL